MRIPSDVMRDVFLGAVLIGCCNYVIHRYLWKRRWENWPKVPGLASERSSISILRSGRVGRSWQVRTFYSFHAVSSEISYVGSMRSIFRNEQAARNFAEKFPTLPLEVVYNPKDPDVSQARIVEKEKGTD